MRDETAELTAATASGDPEAFARLYRAHADWLIDRVRRFTGRDESFALDVAQDVWMKVIRMLRPLATEAELRAWLVVAARRVVLDRLRAERRRLARERAASDRKVPVDSALAEQHAWLREQLAELDETSAGLLTLRYRFGWTLARIGAALGLTPGAVDGRIGRTVAALRRGREELDDA